MYLYLMCKIENMFFFRAQLQASRLQLKFVNSKFRLVGDSRSVSAIETDKSGNGGGQHEKMSVHSATDHHFTT